MTMSESKTFSAVGYPLRLHAGVDALENIGDEARRTGARRAFIVCGQTVAHRTNLLERIEHRLGDRYAGAFDAMDKDSTWPAVKRGTDAARAAGADLLIAVGGGSVIVGTRVIAILLAEPGDAFDLMTQYPEGKPAVSPRLNEPKPPIINVLTTPTGAMNRAGSGLKNEDLDHRMEFYDPKTRPVALFWDADALLTAPPELIRSTATTTFTGSLHSLAAPSMNPLVEGDRLHAFRLSHDALHRLMSEPDDAGLRIDLCAAAFLGNRAGDDDTGRRSGRDAVASDSYALATALHIRYEHVGQGEATSAVTPVVTRLTPPPDADGVVRMAQAIGAWRDGMAASDAQLAVADALDEFYAEIGMPARVGQLDIPEADLPLLANDTLKNFNANPGARSEDHVERMLELLRSCW